jgi:hypothetical protein
MGRRILMLGADLLACLQERGYAAALEEGGRLKVRGPSAPPPELERSIVENKDALKTAVLLSDPPPWLWLMLERYASGHVTEVRRTVPKNQGGQPLLDLEDAGEAVVPYPENLRGGKVVKCRVRVSLANIAAACCAAIGISPLEWERIRSEVEESAA